VIPWQGHPSTDIMSIEENSPIAVTNENGMKDEIKRVTEAFLKMKKFDLKALEQARLVN